MSCQGLSLEQETDMEKSDRQASLPTWVCGDLALSNSEADDIVDNEHLLCISY